jgi:threo-3-hydroxy-L-aspartate ammonia-lyase
VLVHDVVLVSDDEILEALRFLAERARLVVEPSGAAAVAALLQRRVPLEAGETAVAVVSGGNAALDSLSEWLRG